MKSTSNSVKGLSEVIQAAGVGRDARKSTRGLRQRIHKTVSLRSSILNKQSALAMPVISWNAKIIRVYNLQYFKTLRWQNHKNIMH